MPDVTSRAKTQRDFFSMGVLLFTRKVIVRILKFNFWKKRKHATEHGMLFQVNLRILLTTALDDGEEISIRLRKSLDVFGRIVGVGVSLEKEFGTCVGQEYAECLPAIVCIDC